MKILALEAELPDVLSEQFRPYLEREARAVWQLQLQGVIREIYFRGDNHTAVLVLECPDVDEARAVLADLPLVQNGLIEFEVFPLLPYDGFARLFA